MAITRHESNVGSLLLIIGMLLTASTSSAETADEAAAARPGPIDAETAVSQFELPDDLKIELVAAEPDVIDPVAMTFDPDGRLWVVEMSDYPNGPPEDGPPLSRVRVLSDANGDGRYTDPVTFADHLLFATGLMLWKDGLLVTTDGEVLFLRDTDGDGTADEREVWFTGFQRDNPQLRANHPTLGLDNHIYVASGLRGGEVVATRPDWSADAKPVSLSGRDFRFDPLTGDYEAVSGVGQFGLCFDDFGNRFVCSNRNPCKHIVLEDRYLARNASFAVSQVHEDVSPAAEKSRLYPISRIWTTSNLHANQFTAACGVLIYRGDALPEEYRGNSLTCEPTSNLIHRDVLTPQGATFSSRPGRQGVEFLATRDEWFRPVNLTHGPDGALYIADMYRAVIEHPDFMPVELKTRPDLTDGRDRGRIYRITARSSANRKMSRVPRLSQASSEELASRLASANPWERDTSARLLLQRQDTSIAPTLERLVREAGSAATQVRALWLLDGLGQLTRESVMDALTDSHPRVREQAIVLAERRFANDSEFARQCLGLLTNPASDGRLVFQAALSLGSFPSTEAAATALAKVLARSPEDHWLQAAVATSVPDALSGVLVELMRKWNEASPDPVMIAAQVNVISKFAETVASDAELTNWSFLLELLTENPADADDAQLARQRRSLALLRGLLLGVRRSGAQLSQLVPAMDTEKHQALDRTFQAASRLAADASHATEIRIEAIEVLADAPSDVAMQVLPSLASGRADQQLTLAAIDALAKQEDPRVGELLLTGFRHRTPRLRSAVLAAMTTPDRIRQLLDEIESGRISSRDIDPVLAQRLGRLSDEELRVRAKKLLASAVDADRREVVRGYLPALQMPYDLQRGRAVFAKNCATCHRVGDVGVNVGADISDTRTQTPEQILSNVLDPNRAVDGNYFGYSLVDREGRVHTGIIASETASSVTLRQPEGKEATFLRRDIDELVSTGVSLMPVGLEKNIDLQQMADLIGYLKNWRYTDGAVPVEVISGGE